MKGGSRLRSLRFRLPMLLLTCCAVMGGGVSLLTLAQADRAFERAFADRRLAAAVELQGRTERAAERGELEAAQREFGELPADPEVRAAVFLADDNRVLLNTRREWLGRPLDLAALGFAPADRSQVARAMEAARATERGQSRLTADRLGLSSCCPQPCRARRARSSWSARR